MNVPFDARTATLAGAPEPLAQDVSSASHAVASQTGDLLYLSGTTTTDRQIVSMYRAGIERPITRGTHNWTMIRLGNDGAALAATVWDGTRRSVWIVNSATGAMVRLTREVETFMPRITPDGRTVIFNFPSDRGWLWKIPVTGGIPIPLSHQLRGAYVSSISPDGSTLWLRKTGNANDGNSEGNDIWKLALNDSTAKAVPVLVTAADEADVRASPDGRWLAYRTDASGRTEVVIAPVSSPGNATQISTEGVASLNWSADSKRLYYRERNEIREITVGPAGPDLATAHRIFTIPPSFLDVTTDGQHLFAIRGGLMYSNLIMKQGALR